MSNGLVHFAALLLIGPAIAGPDTLLVGDWTLVGTGQTPLLPKCTYAFRLTISPDGSYVRLDQLTRLPSPTPTKIPFPPAPAFVETAGPAVIVASPQQWSELDCEKTPHAGPIVRDPASWPRPVPFLVYGLAALRKAVAGLQVGVAFEQIFDPPARILPFHAVRKLTVIWRRDGRQLVGTMTDEAGTIVAAVYSLGTARLDGAGGFPATLAVDVKPATVHYAFPDGDRSVEFTFVWPAYHYEIHYFALPGFRCALPRYVYLSEQASDRLVFRASARWKRSRRSAARG